MSARTKSVLLLLLSLGLGAVLGALVQARLAEQRLERLALFRSERGLTRALERVIEPTDEAQRQAVAEVLAGSARRMAAQMRQNRERSFALLDSTMQALESVLTEEQMEEVTRRISGWNARIRVQRGARREARRQHRPPPSPR